MASNNIINQALRACINTKTDLEDQHIIRSELEGLLTYNADQLQKIKNEIKEQQNEQMVILREEIKEMKNKMNQLQQMDETMVILREEINEIKNETNQQQQIHQEEMPFNTLTDLELEVLLDNNANLQETSAQMAMSREEIRTEIIYREDLEEMKIEEEQMEEMKTELEEQMERRLGNREVETGLDEIQVNPVTPLHNMLPERRPSLLPGRRASVVARYTSETGQDEIQVVPVTPLHNMLPERRSSLLPGRSASVVARYISKTARLIGANEDSNEIDLNTRTLGMYAVAVVVDSSTRRVNRFRAWLTTFGTLAFVCMQIFVLSSVIFESSYPTCNSVIDCPVGSFCLSESSYNICEDCSHMDEFFVSITHFEETCPTILSAEKWDHGDYVDADYNEFPLVPNTKIQKSKVKEYHCLAYNHCKETDMDAKKGFDGNCDFITRNRQKMHAQTWFLIFFMALLWTLPMCQDIKEASLEEIVLDHYLEGSLNGPAEVIRVALHLRIYLVPFFTTSATLVLLLTEEMSSKTLITNFLAISILSEADNVIAALLLNTRQNQLMESVVKNVKGCVYGAVRMAFIWTRVKGLICLVLFILTLCFINNFVNNCDRLSIFLFQIILYSAFSISVASSLFSVIYTRTAIQSIRERIHVALIDLFRNFFAISIAYVCVELVYIMRFGMDGTHANYRFIWDFGNDLTLIFVLSIVVSIFLLLIVVGLMTLRHQILLNAFLI